MLGHSTIKTTSDRYLHLFDEASREKAENLGVLMSQAQASQRASVIQLATRQA